MRALAPPPPSPSPPPPPPSRPRARARCRPPTTTPLTRTRAGARSAAEDARAARGGGGGGDDLPPWVWLALSIVVGGFAVFLSGLVAWPTAAACGEGFAAAARAGARGVCALAWPAEGSLGAATPSWVVAATGALGVDAGGLAAWMAAPRAAAALLGGALLVTTRRGALQAPAAAALVVGVVWGAASAAAAARDGGEFGLARVWPLATAAGVVSDAAARAAVVAAAAVLGAPAFALELTAAAAALVRAVAVGAPLQPSYDPSSPVAMVAAAAPGAAGSVGGAFAVAAALVMLVRAASLARCPGGLPGSMRAAGFHMLLAGLAPPLALVAAFWRMPADSLIPVVMRSASDEIGRASCRERVLLIV